jgi:ABC-type transporter Mla maintaining outer membrane lipid asymmetry ATPase subunit MlaF
MSRLIEARGLIKRFGKPVAIDHIDFAIEPGRIVGLIPCRITNGVCGREMPQRRSSASGAYSILPAS